jgi:hypothetical protein
MVKWAGACMTHSEKRNAYSNLVGKSEGKNLGRPRRRLKGNIRMDLREIEWELRAGFMRLRIETSGGLL